MPLQFVFNLQLLSFEFVDDVEVREGTSFFLNEDNFDFVVLGAKRFVSCILSHQ